jgi:hypothetical protein
MGACWKGDGPSLVEELAGPCDGGDDGPGGPAGGDA